MPVILLAHRSPAATVPIFEWASAPAVTPGDTVVAAFRVSDTGETTWDSSGLDLRLNPDGANTAGTVLTFAEVSAGEYAGTCSWPNPGTVEYRARGAYTNENAVVSSPDETAVRVVAYPLDAVTGSLGAWSLRPLAAATTNTVRLRNTDDDTTADSEISTLEADIATLSGGTDSVALEYLIDQSGGGNNLAPESGEVVLLAESGVMVTDPAGTIAAWFDGTASLVASVAGNVTDLTVIMAGSTRGTDDGQDEGEAYILNFGASGDFAANTLRVAGQTTTRARYYDGSGSSNDPGDHWDRTPAVRAVRGETNRLRLYQGYETVLDVAGLSSKAFDTLRIGGDTKTAASAEWKGHLSEILLYPDLSDGDFETLVENVGSYWYGEMAKPSAYRAAGLPLPARNAAAVRLRSWLAEQSESDMALPEVSARTSGSITVADVDWTYLEAGDLLDVGRSTFTVSSAALSGSDTVVSVDEDASAVVVGTAALHRLVRVSDGDTSASLAETWNQTILDGDGNWGLDEMMYEPGWTLLDDEAADASVPSITDTATIDEAAPTTTGSGTLVIDQTTGARRFAFVEIDLTGLVSRPTVALLSLSGISLSSDDAVKPYLGAKVYEDIAFDPATDTWNSPPVDITTPPAYDDIEGLDDGETTATLDLTAPMQTAYDNGASTALVALYNVNAEFGASATDRAITIADTPVATLHQAAGIEATGSYRLHQDDNGDERREFGEAFAWHYAQSRTELRSPLQGNPAAARRALAHAVTHLILTHDGVMTGEMPRRNDYYGGWLIPPMVIYERTKDATDEDGERLLPYDVRKAFDDMMLAALDWCLWYGAHDINGNLDTKTIHAAAVAVRESLPESAGLRTVAEEAVRNILYGSPSGQIRTQPYTIDSEAGIFFLDGTVREADGHSLGYLGRALYHMKDAWAALRSDYSTFADLDIAISRMATWLAAQAVVHDGSGKDIGGNAHDARVPPSGPMQVQQYVWPSRTTLYELNNTEGLRTLRGHQALASVLPLTDGELRTAIDAALDGATMLRSANPAPGVWTTGEAWPAEFNPALATSWHSTLYTLLSADDAGTYPIMSDNSTATVDVLMPPDGDGGTGVNQPGQWWSYAAEDASGDRFGWFAENAYYNGTYSAHGGGQLLSMWAEGVGLLTQSRRIYGQDEHANAESLIVNGVWGTDENDNVFIASLARGLETAGTGERTVSYSVAGGWIELTTPFGGSLYGEETGAELTGDLTHTIRRTALTNGQRVNLSIASDEVDQINELWHTIPIYYPDGTTIQVGDGSLWRTTALGTSEAAVEHLRISHDSGVTWWYVAFTDPVSLDMGAATVEDTLPIRVNLHPVGDGSTATFPALTELEYSLLTPAGDPGYYGLLTTASITTPATSGESVIAGHPAAVYWAYGWGNDAAASSPMSVQISTDGGTVYADVGEVEDLGSGQARALIQSWPSSGAHIRIRMTDDTATTFYSDVVTTVVTESAAALIAADDFTDTDSTALDAHTIAPTDPGGSWVFTSGDPTGNAGTITSNQLVPGITNLSSQSYGIDASITSVNAFAAEGVVTVQNSAGCGVGLRTSLSSVFKHTSATIRAAGSLHAGDRAFNNGTTGTRVSISPALTAGTDYKIRFAYVFGVVVSVVEETGGTLRGWAVAPSPGNVGSTVYPAVTANSSGGVLDTVKFYKA